VRSESDRPLEVDAAENALARAVSGSRRRSAPSNSQFALRSATALLPRGGRPGVSLCVVIAHSEAAAFRPLTQERIPATSARSSTATTN
jgi:hypothetical protein